MAMLDFYIEPYVGYANTPDQVCLCGALAGEILALPPELRARVNRFFTAHQTWLGEILKRGVARGIQPPGSGEQGGRPDVRSAAGRAAGEGHHTAMLPNCRTLSRC